MNEYVKYVTEQTLDIIDKARKMKKVGATGGYTREFEITEKYLDEVKDLLSNTSLAPDDLEKIQKMQEMLDDALQKDSDMLKNVEEKILNNVTQEINLKQITLNDLKHKEDTVRNITNQLKNNATILQQANVLGALELIQKAKQKSMQAADEVNKAKVG